MFGSVPLQPEPATCSHPYTEKERNDLITYVRKRYNLPDLITLTLKDVASVGNSCFRRLTFEGRGPLKNWDLTLYASPDARFLTTELFDTTIDPVVERRAKNEQGMRGLIEGPIATRGPKNATVTIVEFSDFECPYCKDFARILDETLSTGVGDVRVVFRHMPLSTHPWARIASEAAGCAELQGDSPFWSLHDRIFQNQNLVTPENAKQKLRELSKDVNGLDQTTFQKCIDSGMSVGLVWKDIDVAETYHVNATPTIFINGQRIQNVDSAAKLRELIATARRESAEAVGSTPAQP